MCIRDSLPKGCSRHGVPRQRSGTQAGVLLFQGHAVANTDYPVNSPLAVKRWSSELMKEALKKTFALQFMGTSSNSLIQIKTEVNKDAGDRITFGLRQQLAGAGVSGDNTLEGNEEALVTYSQNVTIDQ